MHRIASNGTRLVSNTLNINNEEHVIIARGQGEKQFEIFGGELCEEQEFPYLLPKGKCGYKAPGIF